MLQKFGFSCLKKITRLPLPVLYVFSHLIFFIGYYIIGYRKAVVQENIKNSFPEKSPQEHQEIAKKFYQNFSDYIIETAKAFSMKEEELLYRVQHINREVFDDAKKEGKNILLLAGHVFNWEWINALAKMVPQEKSFPVYRKIQNGFWDEQLKNIRDSFGNQSIEAEEVLKHIFRNPNDGNSIYMFVGDQSPQVGAVNFGLHFLNQKTPVYIGYDKLAVRFDLTMVYCEMKKVKRGFYQVTYHRILPEGEQFQPYETVQNFFKRLENTVRKDPSNYLWSHRRWKYASHIKQFADE